jgi:hypothetical protein
MKKDISTALLVFLIILISSTSCVYEDFVRINKIQTLEPIQSGDSLYLNGFIVDIGEYKIYGFIVYEEEQFFFEESGIRIVECNQTPAKQGHFSKGITGFLNGASYSIQTYISIYDGIFESPGIIGQRITYTTLPGKPSIMAYENILHEDGLEVIYAIHDGGSQITSHGLCWGTSSSPTIENDFFSVGYSSTYNFWANATNLLSGHTYYFRLYATNTYGTSYGSEIILNLK